MPDAREPDYPVWRYPTNPPRPRKIPYPGPDSYDTYQNRSQRYRDDSSRSGSSKFDAWGGSTRVDSSEGSGAAYEGNHRGRHDRYGSSDGYGSSRHSQYDSDEESYYQNRSRHEQQGFDSESSTSSYSSPSPLGKNGQNLSDTSSSPGYGNGYGGVGTPKYKENGSSAGGTPYPSSTTGSSDGEYSAAQSDHSYTYPARMYRDSGRRPKEPQSSLAGRGRAEYARGTRKRDANGESWFDEDEDDDD